MAQLGLGEKSAGVQIHLDDRGKVLGGPDDAKQLRLIALVVHASLGWWAALTEHQVHHRNGVGLPLNRLGVGRRHVRATQELG